MPTARRERFLTPQTSGGHHALVCPYRLVGCDALCQREELVDHLSTCRYRQVSTYFPLHTLLRGRSFFLPLSLSRAQRSLLDSFGIDIFISDIDLLPPRLPRLSVHALLFSLSLSLSLSLSQRQIVETQLLLCPHSFAGCPHRVRLCDLASHLSSCDFALALSPRPNKDRDASFTEDYEVVCPYASFGCTHTCMRANLQVHLTRW